jgi:hypothetical protein
MQEKKTEKGGYYLRREMVKYFGVALRFSYGSIYYLP